MEVLSTTVQAPVLDDSTSIQSGVTMDICEEQNNVEDDFDSSGPTESDNGLNVLIQATMAKNKRSEFEGENNDGSRNNDEGTKASVGGAEDGLSKSRPDADESDDCSFQDLSDDDDGSNGLLEGNSSDSSQCDREANASRQKLVEYPTEGKVFLGDNDWVEYFHEFEGDMDFPTENRNALRSQSHSEGGGQFEDRNADADHPHIILRVELPNTGSWSALEYLRGNMDQVKGTGRPDLDDNEDDNGSGAQELVSPVFNTPLVRNDPSASCGKRDVENGSGANKDGEGAAQYSSQTASSIFSGIREIIDRPGVDWQYRTDKNSQSDFYPSSTQVFSDEDFASQEGVGEEIFLDEGEIVTMSREPNASAEQRLVAKQWTSSDSLTMSFGDQDKEGQHELWPKKLDVMSSLQSSTPSFNGLATEGTQKLGVLSAGSAVVNNDINMENVVYEAPVGPKNNVTFRSVRDRPRAKRGAVALLGSIEAEELLQMDSSKLGRAVFTQVPTQPTSSTARNLEKVRSLNWNGATALGPEEVSRYVEALEVKETYIDMVLDMEDILFGAEDGSGARTFPSGKSSMLSIPRSPARDGSISASTSSEATWREGIQFVANFPSEVDCIEVIGAFQKRGGASLGDRMVGLKEHTVYRIRVNRGGNKWEIQRRYRDFVVLHNQLLQLFSHRDKVNLPAPWDQVKAESRKIFGNASPGVVEKRSDLIQFCLQSLLKAGPPLSTATPLLRFLFPSKEVSWSMEGGWQLTQKPKEEAHFGLDESQQGFTHTPDDPPASSSTSIAKSTQDQNDGFQTSVFGKTIRLVVQIHTKKTLRQQLQAQHYTCAGCYKDLESALGLIPEIVQNLGWSGPRYCDYSGQLFCSTCHLNETAIIPARVLQQWDFVPRPVSQLVKAYLDSIYDKPMLCVSAVNPFLYARVPVLAHITELRRTLNKMLGCICCPARSRLLTTMGPRCYLVESNDFFALRDLADLSRGAFAVLPGYMQAMSLKMSRHITRDCSTCQEMGDVCGAGNSCLDPLDVIYPYQEKDITRCRSCLIPYHTQCFYKCQKRCSCMKDHQLAITPANSGCGGEFAPSEAPLKVGNFESDRSSSLLLDGVEPLIDRTVNAAAPGKIVERPKQGFFGSLFGSREGNSSASQVENGKALTLTMRQISSVLDL